MIARSEVGEQVAGRELVISRELDAPRALVWKVWTDPAHLACWWGPKGMATRVEMDVRPGGRYRWVMTDGRGEYPAQGTFREVVAPERLAFTMDVSGHPDEWYERVVPGWVRGQPKPALDTLTTATFEERGRKTLLTVHVLFEQAAIRDSFVKNGMREGWNSSLDRLELDLANEQSTPDREIALTRVFDAPRDLVWKAWTEPQHIAQWWGPDGFRSTIHEMDVRPGGVWRFVLHGPDGTDYQNRIVFLDVVRPERLVYDHVSTPNFRSTATFEELGGKTRLSVRMVFETAALREKTVKTFGAEEGLKQNLGRLAAYLPRM